MPQLIEHIDAIARQKQRDALFVTFFDDPSGNASPYRWESHPARTVIVSPGCNVPTSRPSTSPDAP